MPQLITIRITAPLPIEIDGGRTRWRIDAVYGGKNHEHGLLLAHCLTNGNSITILSGRTRYIEGAIWRRLSAPTGTMLGLIFRKLVRLGLAEEIREDSRPFDGFI